MALHLNYKSYTDFITKLYVIVLKIKPYGWTYGTLSETILKYPTLSRCQSLYEQNAIFALQNFDLPAPHLKLSRIIFLQLLTIKEASGNKDYERNNIFKKSFLQNFI